MKKMLGSTLVLVLLCLAAACGGDDSGSESDDTTTTTAPVETTTSTTAVDNTTTSTTTAGTGTGTPGTTIPGGSPNADAAALNVLSFCAQVDSLGPFLEAEGDIGAFGQAAYDALVPAAETIANDPLIQDDPALAAQANECLDTFEGLDPA